MRTRNFSSGVFVTLGLALLSLRCGENLEGPATNSLLPPQGLKALSLDGSSVRLSWSSPGGTTDSLLRGFVVRWSTSEDSVARSVLTYDADSLIPGVTLFSVFSRSLSGDLSEADTIRWAPADRVDSTFVLEEFSLHDPTQASGFHVGTRSTNPATMPVDESAAASMDFFLYGGFGPLAQPLALWSANLFQGGFKSTKFSTVTNISPTLDYPLSAFPDTASFTKDTIAVADSTIYYVRVVGDNQDVNYARILIRIPPNAAYPNRIIEVIVSLQKMPGVPFAEGSALSHPALDVQGVKLRSIKT